MLTKTLAKIPMTLLAISYRNLLCVIALTALSATSFAQQPGRLKDTWNLQAIYETPADWQVALDKVTRDIKNFDSCPEKQKDYRKPQNVLACLKALTAIESELSVVYSYASLGSDEDQANSEWSARLVEAQNVYYQYLQLSATLPANIVAIGDKRVQRMIDDPEFADYDFYLKSVLRQQSAVLAPEQEQLLSTLQQPYSAMNEAYSRLMNAEIQWPTFKLSDCSATNDKLNSQCYSVARTHPDRSARELAFNKFFSTLKSYRGTLGILLSNHILSEVKQAEARNFESSLDARLNNDAIPLKVYDALVEAAHSNIPALSNFFELRRNLLEVEQLAYYDIYNPVVEQYETNYSIDQAEQILVTALAPMGQDYINKIKQGFKSRWMDVYARPGKRSGAYMNGSVTHVAHPFILLNFNPSYDGVSTVAHELGHALHTLYAHEDQPYTKVSYPTFTAEIASIVPETLLIDHMIDNAESDTAKLYYLMEAMEQIRGTFFRQTMFGEFERNAHAAIEAGEAVTGEKFAEIYGKVLETYHPTLELPEYVKYEWAYIPHFYYNFYVFQYATSLAASLYLVEDIRERGKAGAENFIDLMRKGGSDEPVAMLEQAGVDMTNIETYEAVGRRMQHLVDQANEVLERIQTAN